MYAALYMVIRPTMYALRGNTLKIAGKPKNENEKILIFCKNNFVFLMPKYTGIVFIPTDLSPFMSRISKNIVFANTLKNMKKKIRII